MLTWLWHADIYGGLTVLHDNFGMAMTCWHILHSNLYLSLPPSSLHVMVGLTNLRAQVGMTGVKNEAQVSPKFATVIKTW